MQQRLYKWKIKDKILSLIYIDNLTFQQLSTEGLSFFTALLRIII